MEIQKGRVQTFFVIMRLSFRSKKETLKDKDWELRAKRGGVTRSWKKKMGKSVS